jgi:hypothetical protein
VYVLHHGIIVFTLCVCLVYSLLCVSLDVYVLHHGIIVFVLMCIHFEINGE